MPKPYTYIPTSQIQTGYTSGDEFVKLNGRENYVGHYHVYPNGSVYSNFSYLEGVSEELLPIQNSQYTNKIVQQYVTQKKLVFDKYIKPVPMFVTPTPEDYRLGTMIRYIIQKKNEPEIIFEIDKKQAQSINTTNRRGIDGHLYHIIKFEWSLIGDKTAVRSANLRVLNNLEYTMPGLKRYLSDPLEFFK